MLISRSAITLGYLPGLFLLSFSLIAIFSWHSWHYLLIKRNKLFAEARRAIVVKANAQTTFSRNSRDERGDVPVAADLQLSSEIISAVVAA